MIYRCWEDVSESKADAVDVHADDPSMAAELFAELVLHNGGDPFDRLDVRVATWGEGVEELYRVTIDWEPTFTAAVRQ